MERHLQRHPTNPAKVYATATPSTHGLTEHYVGCGAIDIFYNENWDTRRTSRTSAP